MDASNSLVDPPSKSVRPTPCSNNVSPTMANPSCSKIYEILPGECPGVNTALKTKLLISNCCSCLIICSSAGAATV